MKIKVFHIRLATEHLQNDQDTINSFMDNVIVKKTVTKIIAGQTNFWSILIFYDDKRMYEKKAIKPYDINEIKKTHKQAYEPWTKEADDKLEILYCERKTIKELSDLFSRNEGAIRSRIKKLELKEKYDN